MAKKVYLKLIILFFMIFIIHACSTTRKSSTKESDISTIPIVSGGKVLDTVKPPEPNEFEIKKIEMETKCWINTDPKNCTKYKNGSNDFLYIKSAMHSEKVSDIPTKQQYESIQKKISFIYFQLLNKGIDDDIFAKYPQCRDRLDLCKKQFNKYKISQEFIRTDFEIIDHCWIKMDAGWELNVLAAISYKEFDTDKETIINDKILIELPKLPEVKGSKTKPGLIYIDLK